GVQPRARHRSAVDPQEGLRHPADDGERRDGQGAAAREAPPQARPAGDARGGARPPDPDPGGGDAPGRAGPPFRVRGADPRRGAGPPQGAEGAPGRRRRQGSRLSPTISIRAPVAWLGPGRLVREAAVVASGAEVVYAGSVWGARPADEELQLDGFLLPGYADRHVHIGLSDPVQVVHGGVTAARDLAWPAEDIFPLAEASELPSFRGPLIRAAGPMLTAPGGYPQGQSWAPTGTALVVRGADDATKAVGQLADRGATAIKVSLNEDAG